MIFATAASTGTSSLRGPELLGALREQTKAGQVPHSYMESVEQLFSTIDDLDGDDQVTDAYSGRELSGVHDAKSGWKLQLSVEHTWPRSLGATGTAESDLHHLRTTDKESNTRRGSYPYGEVTGDVIWRVPGTERGGKLGYDASGAIVFEPPAAVKGDIARGLLYFATRYGASDKLGVRRENFLHELPVLVAWHHADPVTEGERKRDAAIRAYQGNGNPYVESPSLVDRVGQVGFAAAFE